jgi:hypothetical protein
LLLDPSHLAVPLIATQTSYNAVPFNSFNLPAGQKWHSVFYSQTCASTPFLCRMFFFAWILKRAREYPTWQEAMVS